MEPAGTPPLFWLIFNLTVLLLLGADLFLFHRKPHRVTAREAGFWSAIWVLLSLGFNAFVWHSRGAELGVQFLTGYLIEYSLSIDNIFVFVLIFSYFKVPAEYQHRVLFWGIAGALIMRGLMIWLGLALIEQFHWVLYLFGGFLIFTGIKIARQKPEDIDP